MAASRYQGGTHNEIAIRKPKREASEETDPASALILDFQLQNSEKINSGSLSKKKEKKKKVALLK